MKMKVRSIACAVLLVFVATYACAERFQVDIAALAASTNQYTSENKVATTNDWILFAIDSYAGKPNIRLSEKGDYLISPTFSQRILSIELKVKSSSQSDRRLAFIPIYDGVPTEDATLWSLCNYSPNKDTYVAQTNFFPRAANVHSFKMAFDNGGGSTGWGISEMTIVTDDTPVLTPPTNLSAGNIKGTRSNLSWVNPENAVSNKIEVSQVAWHEEGGDKVICHTFDEFSNKGDTKDKTESIVDKYPELSDSILLCYPTNSSGQIQISQQNNRGILVHRGLDSYDRMFLLLCLRRYHGDDDSMSIQWIDSNGLTNNLQTVSLSDNFTTEVIALSGIQSNAPIVLNAMGDKTKHRIIIDEMSFVRDYSPASVSTNLVKTVLTTGNAATIKGLSPNSSYIASVTAFDADGNESEPSEPISFMTDNSNLPLVIKLQ